MCVSFVCKIHSYLKPPKKSSWVKKKANGVSNLFFWSQDSRIATAPSLLTWKGSILEELILFCCFWDGFWCCFFVEGGFTSTYQLLFGVVRIRRSLGRSFQDVRFHWHLWILRAVLDLLPTQVFLLDSVPGWKKGKWMFFGTVLVWKLGRLCSCRTRYVWNMSEIFTPIGKWSNLTRSHIVCKRDWIRQLDESWICEASPAWWVKDRHFVVLWFPFLGGEQ